MYDSNILWRGQPKQYTENYWMPVLVEVQLMSLTTTGAIISHSENCKRIRVYLIVKKKTHKVLQFYFCLLNRQI